MTDETQVLDLLNQWEEKVRAGDPVNLEDLCKDSPQLLQQVQRGIAALNRLEPLLQDGDGIPLTRLADSTDDGGDPALATGGSGPPAHIGRYRVDRVLGQGGFGTVYLAQDEQLGRPVAVKVPHRKLVARPEDAALYRTEGCILARLDHPHIVPVFDVGSTPDCPFFIVSKYIEGSTLAHQIKAGRLPLGEAVDLVATVAETLHYAHRQGLVHRDIKPRNILLDKSGKAYVADFGLALREQDVGKGPCYAGTPAYMSPEQARGEGHRVDGRSDIFSLGVVFYELLTGRRPFQADSLPELLEQISRGEPRPPRQRDDGIPKELERICFKALSKQMSERYLTAKDLADDLRLFRAQGTDSDQAILRLPPRPDPRPTPGQPLTPSTELPAESVSPAPVPSTSRSRRRLLIAGFLALLLVGASLAAWQLAPAGNPLVWWRVPPSDESTAIDPSFKGSINVRVWDPVHPERRRLKLDEPGALPLRVGDAVRVEAEMRPAAYLYVIIIDPAGKAQPAYPWKGGAWEERTPEQPRTGLSLPETAVDEGWRIDPGPRGMDTVLLLARSTPLSGREERQLRDLLSGLPAMKEQSLQAVAWFENGQVAATAEAPRSWSFDTRKLDDPVLRTQALLKGKLKPLFAYTRAVSYANAGQ